VRIYAGGKPIQAASGQEFEPADINRRSLVNRLGIQPSLPKEVAIN